MFRCSLVSWFFVVSRVSDLLCNRLLLLVIRFIVWIVVVRVMVMMVSVISILIRVKLWEDRCVDIVERLVKGDF